MKVIILIKILLKLEPVLILKREQFNLTPEQLAILIEIKIEEIKKLENDEYQDIPKFAEKLAKQLNCSLEDLFEE